MEILKLVLSPAITFLVGVLAYLIYRIQKRDNRRDAARIIIQEIRRAEDIIADYKHTGSYQFAKKIIATNSWTKNIHYFVGDLTNDELDKISDLYSTGEYLDNLIREISQITLEHEIERAKELSKQQLLLQSSEPSKTILVPGLPPVWKARLDAVSLKLETIYHSTIVGKLKKIAKIK